MAAGALCYGLMAGWASGFVGWTWRGLAFRALIFSAVVTSVANLAPDTLLLGLFGTAGGVLAHEMLVGAIRWRSR